MAAESVRIDAGAAPEVPRSYWMWLGGTTLSLLGTQAMAFALAWVATGQGGVFAGLMLTAINLPRVLLLLFGGAVADRVGAWKVMITADAAMVLITVVLAIGAWSLDDPRALLLVTALAIGIVDAFYLPSSGSMPRRLVPGPVLARAMSARQVAGQLTVFTGPPLGGLLVAAAGLAAAALANAATFAVMLLILVVLRPRVDQPPATGAEQKLWRTTLDGLRVAWSDRVLRLALLLTVAAAAFLLPVSGLLVPLLARDRNWSAQVAGTVVGAIALGGVVVAVTVMVRDALPRPGLAAASGLLLAAASVCALAFARAPLWAIAAGAAVGAGTGIFTTHIGPLILGAAPGTHLARVQSVLVLAQSLPLLITNNALGSLSDAARTPMVMYLCAAALAMAGLAALRSPALRGVGKSIGATEATKRVSSTA